IWRRPARPGWMDAETYEQIPAEMEVRELRVQVRQRGFRTRTLVIVTTLLDAEIYTKQDLAALYRQRWHAELDLRSIKVVLGMDVLRCKTPEMVRKEIWMHLLVYNLIRTLMARAAEAEAMGPRPVGRAGVVPAMDPRQVSFAGALQL